MKRVSWPPRRAIIVAVELVALLVLVCGAGRIIGGAPAALGLAFGSVCGLAAAVTDVGWGARVALSVACAVGFELGALSVATPALAGLLVAAAAMAQIPFTLRGARVATMVPVVTALGASSVGASEHASIAVWVSVGVLVMAALAAAMRVSVPPQPTSTAEAARHCVATALVAGVGFAVARALEVGHGYWLVLAAAAVLGVSRDATAGAAAERVAGTLSGVLLGVLIVASLPLTAVILVAAGALVLTLAWTIVSEVRLAALGASAVAVLIGSGGLVGNGAGLAVERLALTIIGAGLASGAAAVLWRLDSSRDTPSQILRQERP